jgi:shikimate kinase
MILKLKQAPGIYLVGFMGSGKTTVGRLLADQMGWPFADIDDDIEAAEKTKIPLLFATRGETEFRRIESQIIQKRVRKIQAGQPMVIALGGGSFTIPENIDLLLNNGVTIWLDASFDVVQHRVNLASHRPLAKDPVRFEQLFQERRPFYGKADYRVEINDDDSRKALHEILNLPIFD